VKHKTIEGSVQIDTTPTASVAAIACATVIEEMRSYLPPGVEIHALDFGLHVNPRELKRVLQETVDAVATGVNTTLLGYGLCSMAVVGLQATGRTLVVPRVDDCIAIFLGSDAAYRHQTSREPGTYYLTKGWIEAGDSPFEEYDRLVAQYGEAKARWIMDQMLKNYTRLALINTGHYEMDRYRDYSRCTAARFGLPSLTVATLYMLALGFVSNFVPTLVFTLAPETMPTLQLAGLALAIVAIGSGLGVLTGPPVLGSILNGGRWTLGSICLGVVMGLGTIASVLAGQRMRST